MSSPPCRCATRAPYVSLSRVSCQIGSSNPGIIAYASCAPLEEVSMHGVKRTIAWWLTSAAVGYCGAAFAQDKPADYPARPIRVVVAASAGAGGVMMARAIAQRLVDAWGQNVIVDNRPGASGTIGVELVARSAPDGYTLLSLGDTLIILGATKRLPFDVLKAFDPVVPTSVQPYIILAHPSLTAKSVKELVAYSATRPITYSGSTGVGSTVHLGMERLA